MSTTCTGDAIDAEPRLNEAGALGAGWVALAAGDSEGLARPPWLCVQDTQVNYPALQGEACP